MKTPIQPRRPYLWLLLSLSGFFFVTPFLPVSIKPAMIGLLISLQLLAAVYAVVEKRSVFLLAVALVVPSLVSRWLAFFLEQAWFDSIANGLGAAFLFLTVCSILRHVLIAEYVTSETIFGALCVYLLIGVLWAFLFALVEFHAPGALQSHRPLLMTDMLYFSYVTLTTLGYGDIVPSSEAARSLATLEAIVGQVYLTALVARLVGLQISHSLRKN